MARTGMNHIVWTKKLDEKLLQEIKTGKPMMSLEISMRMGEKSIKKRLKQMGFENFIDARNTLIG